MHDWCFVTCPTPTYNKSHEANAVQTVIMWLPATSTDLPRTAHRVGPRLCRIKRELLELIHSAAVYQVSMKILSQIMGWCQDWSWSELIWLINWNQASRCQEGLDWTRWRGYWHSSKSKKHAKTHSLLNNKMINLLYLITIKYSSNIDNRVKPKPKSKLLFLKLYLTLDSSLSISHDIEGVVMRKLQTHHFGKMTNGYSLFFDFKLFQIKFASPSQNPSLHSPKSSASCTQVWIIQKTQIFGLGITLGVL